MTGVQTCALPNLIAIMPGLSAFDEIVFRDDLEPVNVRLSLDNVFEIAGSESQAKSQIGRYSVQCVFRLKQEVGISRRACSVSAC